MNSIKARRSSSFAGDPDNRPAYDTGMGPNVATTLALGLSIDSAAYSSFFSSGSPAERVYPGGVVEENWWSLVQKPSQVGPVLVLPSMVWQVEQPIWV